MRTGIDVSIIIVNYNTLKMTKECIDSIYEKTRSIEFEVIVVDNASNDGSKFFFENDVRIKYYYIDENLGFGRANNEGVKHATGTYLFFLNSDTLLRNNAIQILFEYLESKYKVGVVGGNLFNAEGLPCISFERRYPGIVSDFNLFSKGILNKLSYGVNQRFNHLNHPINVAYISGADLMISKSLFTKAGGFLPDYFMYFEETDLCYRIHKYGYKIQSVPNAEIIHFEGGSQKKDINAFTRKMEMFMKSRNIFMRKNHGALYYKIDKLLILGFYYLKMIFKRNRDYSKTMVKLIKQE